MVGRYGRCWEVPTELLFPRAPLLRAIRRAAPQVTVVTNTDMPGRDPMRENAAWGRNGRSGGRYRTGGGDAPASGEPPVALGEGGSGVRCRA